MITVSVFGWVPEFARGVVRDLRVRWALEEAGLTYKEHVLREGEKETPDYLALQPFGRYLPTGMMRSPCSNQLV
ncbi:hypothetical protein [Kordiimonas gwangyangensis]|uniref:hypothetical protein n=1 Tax=Kordiimonas gwangyangensis TaxID=288022 RepID=UPI000A6948C2|nr:hypothetical protein [Kordiimonas gwangyangensis]